MTIKTTVLHNILVFCIILKSKIKERMNLGSRLAQSLGKFQFISIVSILVSLR